MMNEPRKWAKKNIKNYIEIYIKADLKEIIRLKKKKFTGMRKNKILSDSILILNYRRHQTLLFITILKIQLMICLKNL